MGNHFKNEYDQKKFKMKKKSFLIHLNQKNKLSLKLDPKNQHLDSVVVNPTFEKQFPRKSFWKPWR